MRYFLILFAFFCSSLLGAKDAQQISGGSIKIVPQKATLSNGIRLIVFKNPILPSVTVWTGYNVGTADDPVDLVGLSHMLEHMMFKGTPSYPEGSIDSIINQLGGELNALTSFDYTVYTFSIPAQYLEKVFDIEADRMSNLNFNKESFLAEQKVIIEERQMRIGNHPLRTASEVCRRAQFMAHPYGVYPIGYEGNIRSYTHEALMNHYKKYYVPNNATVIVVGPFDLPYVLSVFEKKFGSISSKPLPVKNRLPEPDREGLTTTVEQENSRAENIYIEIFYRAPTLIKKPEDFQKMQVMLSALFGSETRVLYKEMVKEKRLALDVSGDYAYGKDDMGFSFRLQLSPDMDVDAAEAFLFEQLQLYLQNGLNESDFKAAKQEKLNSFAYAMDGEDFLVSMAESIIEGFPVEDISRYEQLVSDVTIEQARGMLELVLSNPPVLIARNYPKGKMPAKNYHKIGKKIDKKEIEKKFLEFSAKKNGKSLKKAKKEKG